MATATDLKTDLDGTYAELERAFQTRDLATIGRFTAEDFVAHTPDGKTKNKTELLMGLADMFQGVEVLAWPRRIAKLDTIGSRKAVATAVGTFKTRKPSGEVTETELINEDTWENRNGNWVISSSRPA